jgi:hypothetical protein
MPNGRKEGRGEELARPTGPDGLDKSRQCGGGRSGADAGKDQTDARSFGRNLRFADFNISLI